MHNLEPSGYATPAILNNIGNGACWGQRSFGKASAKREVMVHIFLASRPKQLAGKIIRDDLRHRLLSSQK